jgi:GT2 family glycosyltransferase
MMLCYNTTPEQLELTKMTLASVIAQDIGDLDILLVDNGSTGETQGWIASLPQEGEGYTLDNIRFESNTSPIAIVNDVASKFFDIGEAQHYLGIPNDVVLPPNCYRELLRVPRGLVAAMMDNYGDPRVPRVAPPRELEPSEATVVGEDCHFSVTLVRRWLYDALVAADGYFFDPGYFMYASDCDQKERMKRIGVTGAQTDLRCWHYSSACWRLAAPGIGNQITSQANNDRAHFFSKWGYRL